jgi:homoserine dehydrogenase
VLKAIANGKHVVTANKALLAVHGNEIFAAAQQQGVIVAFEAAVAGGIPIIKAVREGLTANRIEWIAGIINGTTNYILSTMRDSGRPFADVLADAQALGYAEADPTLDVDGTDAAHKLSILAHLAFGVQPPLESIPRRGIDGIDAVDIRFASELGYTIRLLAESWNREGKLAMHVSPVLLRKQAPLAQVRGAYNAVALVGDAVEDTLYYGKGAGMLPTASSIVADLVDLAVSRERMVHRTGLLWPVGVSNEPAILPDTDLKSRFYLRLLLPDRPGIMAEVAGILATHRISIASVIQHESTGSPDSRVQMVIMTHEAPTSDFRMAVEEINRRGFAVLPVTHYPVAD